MVMAHGVSGTRERESALLFDDPLQYTIVKSYSWIGGK